MVPEAVMFPEEAEMFPTEVMVPEAVMFPEEVNALPETVPVAVKFANPKVEVDGV
jgi:hypothetical protein